MLSKNLIITTIIGVFLTSIIVIQPTKTEAGNNLSPAAMPTPRKNKIAPRRTKPKPANYTAGGTWVSGDPLTFNKTRRKTSSRKKPKGTRNLLPYIEQSNLRKGKRNK